MNGETLNIEICNPTNEKLVASLFNIESLDDSGGGIPVFDGSGLIYNTSGGAGNGSQMLSNQIRGSFYDTINNIIYAATANGLWVYDIDTDTGSIISTATSVIGQSLQSNDLRDVTVDIVNNTLYAIAQVAQAEIWKYDMTTNTGSRYTTSSGVSSGVNLPGTANELVFENTNNFLWVAGQSYIWRLNNANNGENVTLVVSGNAYPTTSGAQSIHYDILNNLIFVGKFADGLYRYNPVTDNGHVFNISGGAGSGSQIPANRVESQIGQNGNVLYVPTFGGGIWIYNITTDTGSIIDTSTPINGDVLPTNQVRACFWNSDDNKLYIGSFASWSYEPSSNTGFTLGAVTSGDPRQAGTTRNVYYIDGIFWDLLQTPGMWRWNEYVTPSGSPIVIQSNEANDVSYDYITRDVQQSPIEIRKIILISENSLQKYNSLAHVLNTILGSETTYDIHFSDYVNPLLPFRQIHVELEKPFVIDYEKFLQLPIEANTCVQLLFEYQQISPARLMEHLSPEKDDVLPIYYPELGITDANAGFNSEIDDKNGIVSETKKPEMNWLGPWIVLGIISILLRLKYQ